MSVLLRRLFWVALFLGATFCWYVLFEHGFSPGAFFDGARAEWHDLAQWLRADKP